MKPAVEIITDPRDVVRYLSSPEGSRDWAIGLRYEVQAHAGHTDGDATHLADCLYALYDSKGWRYLRTGQGGSFESFEEFCRAKPPYGLGLNWRKARTILDQSQESTPAKDAPKPPPNGNGFTNGTSRATAHLPPLIQAKQACRGLSRLEQADLLRWLQQLTAIREGG
jgi:hypothetical protein